MVASILVPTDFSPTSDSALQYATQMALTLGARLYLMHVPGKTGEHFEANYPLGRFETATRERLSSFLTTEELEQLRPEYALRVGAPAEEIVRYADACDVDLIIMSNSNIHNHAPLPVLIAGGAAGRLKGGRHLMYPEGTPMSNLLLTILDKAGVRQEKVGDSTGLLSDV